MFTRVLMTADGSPLSRVATEHAVRLVDPVAGELRVLAVVEALPRFTAQSADLDARGAGRGGVAGAMAAELVAGSTREIETIRAALVSAGIPRITVDVVAGPPGASVVAYAREHACDAVVMSTHGRSGLARTMLGSVTDYVVQHLRDVPLVLVRPTTNQETLYAAADWMDRAVPVLSSSRGAYRHVLIGLDGSSFAMTALPVAVRTCAADGRLTLVEVIDRLPRTWRSGETANGDNERSLGESEASESYARAQQRLAVARGRLGPDVTQSVSTVILGGMIEDELAAYARAEAVDLVVMTTHGRSGITRTLMGSVPNAMLRNLAGTPLLVVHPD